MASLDLVVSLAGVILPALGLLLTIHHHHRATGYLTVSLNPSAAVNPSGIGTYLAAIATVSNLGKEPAFFGGFHALDKEGEYWYPSSTIQCGSKLEPGQYIQGAIAAATLSNAKVLWVVDGTGRKVRVNRWLLRKVKRFLEQESARWNALALDKNAK